MFIVAMWLEATHSFADKIMTIITAEAEIMLTLLQVRLFKIDESTKAEPSTLK